MEEQNTGGDFNIFLLKFDTDKELSDKVVKESELLQENCFKLSLLVSLTVFRFISIIS
jgi:hypothetical protein